MGKDAVMHVRIDPELKADAEKLYASMGTTLSEAVRVFARQSVQRCGFPFFPTSTYGKGKMHAKGLLYAYADKAMREAEREAWIRSLSEKYAHLNR